MADIRDTLVHPFDRGVLSEPSPEKRFAFINARPLNNGRFRDSVDCEQPFRPDFLQLEEAGYQVTPEIAQPGAQTGAQPGGKAAAGTMMLIGRSRKRNEIDLFRAWSLTGEGGTVIVAGAKKDGIAALRKWAAQHVAIADSLSKHHGVVFWFERSAGGNPFPPEDRPGSAAPGMFSAGKPDAGSRLLASHFDDAIAGNVADFGAGWGFLSGALADSGANPHSIACYEADWRALRACETNLQRLTDGPALSFHWIDLVREPVGRRFDWIIMNPPFHIGRAADPALGRSFIEIAARSLKKGGRLLMVANRNLPYEQTLQQQFSTVDKLCEQDGFKVFRARR